MKALLSAAVVYASLIKSSWAYVNPGTSNLILQGIAASFAVVMGFVILGRQRINLNLFRKSHRMQTDASSADEPAP